MGETDYDYGPPVETEGETGTPAETYGDDVLIEGASPHTPPENTDVVDPPGGSPSEESGVAPEPIEPPVEPPVEPPTEPET